ncbi:MAG: hypothetical protein ABI067_14660 [Leifsonia sp.]
MAERVVHHTGSLEFARPQCRFEAIDAVVLGEDIHDSGALEAAIPFVFDDEVCQAGCHRVAMAAESDLEGFKRRMEGQPGKPNSTDHAGPGSDISERGDGGVECEHADAPLDRRLEPTIRGFEIAGGDIAAPRIPSIDDEECGRLIVEEIRECALNVNGDLCVERRFGENACQHH